jgi:CHAT domain-containing protein
MLKPDGKYVIDDKNIIIVSNTNEIYTQKREKKKASVYNAVLFGYPNYFKNIGSASDIQIPALNGSKIEVEQIDSLMKVKHMNSMLYIEDNATEDEFKSIKSADIIHIATHGFFNPDIEKESNNKVILDEIKSSENPLINSGLLFAGIKYIDKDSSKIITGTEDDGLLTAYEASNLYLDNTKLVILSACETGLGTEKNGDGVYGLQRAFLVAGAESLVMSLWKVNDYVTQELMFTFYKYLLSGNNISDSFKKAQIEIKSKYSHPYFWGAFVLVSYLN